LNDIEALLLAEEERLEKQTKIDQILLQANTASRPWVSSNSFSVRPRFKNQSTRSARMFSKPPIGGPRF